MAVIVQLFFEYFAYLQSKCKLTCCSIAHVVKTLCTECGKRPKKPEKIMQDLVQFFFKAVHKGTVSLQYLWKLPGSLKEGLGRVSEGVQRASKELQRTSNGPPLLHLQAISGNPKALVLQMFLPSFLFKLLLKASPKQSFKGGSPGSLPKPETLHNNLTVYVTEL